MELRYGLLDECFAIDAILEDFDLEEWFAIAGGVLHEDVPVLAVEERGRDDNEVGSADSRRRS